MRSDRDERARADARKSLRLSLAAIGCASAAFVLGHVVLEAASRHAEVELGASLWRGEEHLQLLTPTNWVGRGEGRVLLCGPSIAREAFRVDLIGDELDGLRAFPAAQSWGTLEDCLVMLEYIERAYGPTAIPDHIVLGITPRWACNLGLHLSPTLRHIDRYSPRFRVESTAEGLELVEKNVAESMEARWRFLAHQGTRYSGAILAFARELARTVRPSLAEDRRLEDRLDPYRFAHKGPRPYWMVERFVKHPSKLWADVRSWDAREDSEQIRRDIGGLLAFCEEYDISLYAVILPMRSEVRGTFDDELYAAYVSEFRGALGETPFLDLTDFLTDEEFFDSAHPSRAGAVRVSRRVARLIERSIAFRSRELGS